LKRGRKQSKRKSVKGKKLVSGEKKVGEGDANPKRRGGKPEQDEKKEIFNQKGSQESVKLGNQGR